MKYANRFDGVMQGFRNERSIEMYGKPEEQLQLGERMRLNEYIRDYLNPEWADIKIDGENTGYHISNIGQVMDRNGKMQSFETTNRKDKRPQTICIQYNGKDHYKFIHQCIAELFLPNPDKRTEVNHINGNNRFNWVGNLEWVTPESVSNIKVGRLKLSSNDEANAHNVCMLSQKGWDHQKIAKFLNLPESFVISVMFTPNWVNVTKKYKMPEVKHLGDIKTIHKICDYLSYGYKPEEISKELKVDQKLCEDIKEGKEWRNISDRYNIPGLKKTRTIPELVSELVKEGITDTFFILDKLHLEHTRPNKEYIIKIKRSLKCYVED